MRRIEIKEGQQFNRWTVIREIPTQARRRMFFCRCDCGTESTVDFQSLRYGNSKSCGCLTVGRYAGFAEIAAAANAGEITPEMVRSLLIYDPQTGLFTRRVSTNGAVRIGQNAGARANGYVFIKLFQRRYAAHRLAWAYVYGEWPPGPIDHVNGIKSDNQITNIRPATYSQNIANTLCRRDSRSGMKGVSRHTSGRWRAKCRVNGIIHHLGMFDTKEEAHAAYTQFASKAFGPYFCDGISRNDK